MCQIPKINSQDISANGSGIQQSCSSYDFYFRARCTCMGTFILKLFTTVVRNAPWKSDTDDFSSRVFPFLPFYQHPSQSEFLWPYLPQHLLWKGSSMVKNAFGSYRDLKVWFPASTLQGLQPSVPPAPSGDVLFWPSWATHRQTHM